MVKFSKLTSKNTHSTKVFDTEVSKKYGDLPSGQGTSITVAGGTGNLTTAVMDFPVAVQPQYGSAKLDSFKLGIFTHEYSQGSSASLPTGALFKLKENMGDNEGNINLENKSPLVFSSYMTEIPNSTAYVEDFANAKSSTDMKVETKAGNLIEKSEPYLLLDDAWDNRDIDAATLMSSAPETTSLIGSIGLTASLAIGTALSTTVGLALSPLLAVQPFTKAKFKSYYGTKSDDGQDIVEIKLSADQTKYVPKKSNWKSAFIDDPSWSLSAKETLGFKTAGGDIGKYLKYKQTSSHGAHDRKTSNLNSDSTFFDVCKEVPNKTAKSYDVSAGTMGESKEFATSDISFDTSKALSGQSMLLHTFIDHRNSGSPTGGYINDQPVVKFNNSSRQDIYCAKSFIPSPVRYTYDTCFDYHRGVPFTAYENEKLKTAYGGSSVEGFGQGFLSSKMVLDIDMFIEKLEPDVKTTNLKARRGIAICFSDVFPGQNDTFFDFIKNNTDGQSSAKWNKNFSGIFISDIAGNGEYTVTDIVADTTFNSAGAGFYYTTGTGTVPGSSWVRLRFSADAAGATPADSGWYGDKHTWNLMCLNPSDDSIVQDFNAGASNAGDKNMLQLLFSLDSESAGPRSGTFSEWGNSYKPGINHPRLFPKHMTIWMCNYRSEQTGSGAAPTADVNVTKLGNNDAYVLSTGDSEAGNRPVENKVYFDKIAFKRVSPKIVNCTPSDANTGFIANSFKIINSEKCSFMPDHEMVAQDTLGTEQLKLKQMSPPTVLSFGFSSPSDLGTVNGGSNSGLMLFSGFFTGNLAANEKIHDAKMMGGYTRKQYSPLLGDMIDVMKKFDRKEKNTSTNLLGTVDISEGPMGFIPEYRTGVQLSGNLAATTSDTSHSVTTTNNSAIEVYEWIRINGEFMYVTAKPDSTTLTVIRRGANWDIADFTAANDDTNVWNRYGLPRYNNGASQGYAHKGGSEIMQYRTSGGPTITTSAHQIGYIKALQFSGGNPATILTDGTTVTINDGTTSKTFEFDNNSSVTGSNIAVAMSGTHQWNGVTSGTTSPEYYAGHTFTNFVNLTNAINSVSNFNVEAIYQNSSLDADYFNPDMTFGTVVGNGGIIKIRRTEAGNDSDAAISCSPHSSDVGKIKIYDFNTALDKANESFTQKGFVKFDEGSANSMTNNWVKRENPWVSAKITKLINPSSGEFEVDNSSALKNFPDDEYIIYRQYEDGNSHKFKITVSGQPSDGDKITLNDRVTGKHTDHQSIIFEFEDDDSVTSGNIPVAIGSDVAATLQNLANAIDKSANVPSVSGYELDPLITTGQPKGFFQSNWSLDQTNATEVWIEFTDWYEDGDTEPTCEVTTDSGAVMTIAKYGGNAISDAKDSKYGVGTAMNEPTYIAPVKIRALADNSVRVSYVDGSSAKASNLSSILKEEYLNSLRISPYKYWMFWQIRNDENHNMDSWGIQGRVIYHDEKVAAPRSYVSAGFVDSNTTIGYTFNESKYFVDAATNNQLYYKAHNILPQPGGEVEMEKDYGFGVWDDENIEEGAMGAVGKFKIKKGRTECEIPNLSKVDSDIKTGDIISFMMTTEEVTDSHRFKFYSSNYTTDVDKRPYLLTIFEDEKPEMKSFEVLPNKDNPYYPEFTWQVDGNDLWYGFISVSDKAIDSQYTNAILHFPLNEEPTFGTTGDVDEKAYHGTALAAGNSPIENISMSSTNVLASGVKYDIEGLAGYSLRFDGTNDYIKYGTATSGNFQLAATSDPTSTATTEMTVIAHIIPDSGGSDDRYIIAQEETGGRKFSIKLNSSNRIVAKVYDGESSNIELTSGSTIVTNGEIPTSIILTVDTKIVSGNVKLFINGNLEDQTGMSLATGTTNNWQINTNMQSGNGYLVLGNSTHSSVTLDRAFDGKLEEIVIYDKCLYPINPKESKYIFTKNTSELASGQSIAQSKSNVARLFIKDYHNIRGSTPEDVCSSSQISWRKAAFSLDTS